MKIPQSAIKVARERIDTLKKILKRDHLEIESARHWVSEVDNYNNEIGELEKFILDATSESDF